jgi:hypothetical protein
MMHIPFERLPPEIQEKITGYLQTDNFQAAKQLRDQYETYLRGSTRKFGKKARTKVNLKISESDNRCATRLG